MFMSKRIVVSIFVMAALIVGCSSGEEESSSQPSQQPQQSQMQQGQQGKKGPMLNQKKSVDPSSITDEELRKFAQIRQEAQKVRTDARSDMKEIIEDEGMSLKRYQKIRMSQQSKKMQGSVDVSDAEQAKMDSIRPQMKEAQKSAQKDMMNAMQSTGLSMQRVQQISRALQQSKELQKRFKKIESEMMGQGSSNGSQ